MAILLFSSGLCSGWGMQAASADGTDIILYVKMDGDDTNSGTSWDDAFATLQKALDTADTRDGQTYQIWIAKGTYIPTQTFPASSVCVERIPDPPNPPEVWQCVRYEMRVDPRTAHFAMKNDVAIYGGFAGTEDPASFSLADRDFVNNETILSGYLGVDQVLNPLSAYHVFYHPNLALDATAVLDGVTISGGRGVEHQGYGGGMYNDKSSPALTNVTFSGNYAQYAGGAMANQSSNPTLTHVTISGNEARSGGGIYNSESSPILTHVTISDNKAFINEGGGMSNNSGSSPVLTHVTISGNEANIGGGMYNSDSSPTLTNVTISGNKARNISPGGKVGGGIYTRNGSLTLTHVTISGNWAASEAGGMYNDESATTIRNSIIWGNSATHESNHNIVISPWWSTFPVISHSLIEYSNGSGDNWNASVGSDDGNNIDADPKFIDYQLATIDSTSSGDYRLRKDSPAINAGNSIDIPNGIITDLDGNSRVAGASVDMGAYEYERALPVPRNLIGTAGDRQVTLSWDVVSFADSYEVYKYEGATGPVTTHDWELVASDINVTTYEVTELTNGTGYAFAVKAVSTLGDSDFTDAAIATPSAVPDAPSGVSATAGNGQAVVSFTVPTNNGGSAITGYTVTALVDSSATGIIESGTASPITVSGLTSGTTYTFTVRATNAAGDSAESDASDEVTPRTVPDAPSDVSATAGNEQVVVSFTAPTNNGGSGITGYTVTALVNGSATGITATGTAS
ncbi:MAG: fibronectin type III domain-containing protein, partial [Paenibacillaceae bacterium]|nr:fibronectin type III domain-containing protein [Paenibacillaceae bacterium]